MEEFKKDLLKVCGKNTAALIIFFVLGGVFLAFGLLMWITAYDPFDAQTDGYATMEVTYVMGPFAELTSDGKITQNSILQRILKVTGVSLLPREKLPFRSMV